MDDDYGNVSRAMRNRSVELYILSDDCAWFKGAQDLVVHSCFLTLFLNVYCLKNFHRFSFYFFPCEHVFKNMIMNTGNQDILRIKSTLMESCKQLSCWELLKLRTLLKERDIEFENAIKVYFHVGSTCVQEIEQLVILI